MNDIRMTLESAGALGMLLLGLALLGCGVDVCWLRFRRGGTSRRRALAPRGR